MKVRTALSLAIAVLATTANASDATTSQYDMADKRLRGCLAAGAATAPQTNLAAALQSTRAFCGPQIADLAAFRTREASKGLSGEAAEKAKTRALRELNNEIALTVANLTGLTQ